MGGQDAQPSNARVFDVADVQTTLTNEQRSRELRLFARDESGSVTIVLDAPTARSLISLLWPQLQRWRE
jgi:hypothetical protein